MKKLNLRMRLTLLSSIMLTLACIILTLVINLSASKMVDTIRTDQAMIDLTPAIDASKETIPAMVIGAAQQKTFHFESLGAMLLIVFIGSAATYLLSGRALRPVSTLAEEVKHKNITNLQDILPLPETRDEIYELSEAFNLMMLNLEKAFQLQTRFSADAAHELRTPLTVMQTKLEIYLLSVRDTETKNMLMDLNTQIDRLTQLIDDLLWFSKNLPIDHIVPIDLKQLIGDVANELKAKSDEKHQQIILFTQACKVMGNDALLERVFYNLLENAIKYSAANSTISVLHQQDSGKQIISVIDEGDIIPDEAKAMIFEPFYRLDPSRNRNIGGSGLGLAICKKILERHQAEIRCLNHPKGNIFEITFTA